MEKSINTIRFLGVDMVNEANSGHPGIVLGAAPVMYQLFTKHLKHNPENSDWFDRDRFILSAGHGSALLYATLHLSGYDLPLSELKKFRQVGSTTPGHPEYGDTDGVEATTGPLGQGISNAVGMAIAEKNLRHRYNKKDLNIIDHYTYTLCGDGDLQEGVAMESMSLAGHLGLERLIVLFDSNDVQLDGPTKDATSEDIAMKVKAMGWDYQLIEDANDLDALDQAIEHAKTSDKPSFIEIKSVIGFGSEVAGTSKAHGAPVGKEEAARMRKAFGFSHEPFDIQEAVYEDFQKKIHKNNDQKHLDWQETMEEYATIFPKAFEEIERILHREIDVDFDKVLQRNEIGSAEATRASMGAIVTELQNHVPEMIGGSADLSGSTKVKGIDGNFIKETPTGRNINFGVREHAMGAIINGLALHQMKGFAGGFFIFSDYMKPAIRLAALMQIPSLFIFTHDSVAVGEDGPTHEPVEQLSMFRTMPNIITLRPANQDEARHAMRFALSQKKTPSILVCTRQNVTQTHHVDYEDFKKGAYVVRDKKDYEGILIATGSELELALDVQKALEKDGINVRVVSMPSMELFDQQSDKYKETILPKTCEKRLAIELGSPHIWYKYATHVKGLERFGKSGKGSEVVKSLGFDVKTVSDLYKAI